MFVTRKRSISETLKALHKLNIYSLWVYVHYNQHSNKKICGVDSLTPLRPPAKQSLKNCAAPHVLIRWRNKLGNPLNQFTQQRPHMCTAHADAAAVRIFNEFLWINVSDLCFHESASGGRCTRKSTEIIQPPLGGTESVCVSTCLEVKQGK